TSCEGCQFAILDLHEDFLALTAIADFEKFRLIEEKEDHKGLKFDVAFMEGSALTKENLEALQDIRKRSKVMVAMGACAHTGGIYALKKYKLGKTEAAKKVYPKTFKERFNYLSEGIDKEVKIDYYLPGCPATAIEFVSLVKDLHAGKKFEIPQRPVCYECQLYRKVDCLLQQGKPCLGPVTLGGCNAVCPAGGMECEGCRGPLEDANWKNMAKALEKILPKEDMDDILEIFHVKELIKRKK
ncbi:hypothetical protein KKF29_01150, partial [Patescibacteria group bacterium]|nr:hypothetical protein [Patescibacteria group bacterium]